MRYYSHGVIVGSPSGARWLQACDLDESASQARRLFMMEESAIRSAKDYRNSFADAGLEPPPVTVVLLGKNDEILKSIQVD